MGRPEQVSAAIRGGKSPRTITQEFGISYSSVVGYLDTAAGRGLLLRSEILFAIDKGADSVVEYIMSQTGIRTSAELTEWLWKLRNVFKEPVGIDTATLRDDALLYFRLRGAVLADMYEYLCRVETYLHTYIRTELQRGFGPQEWWRKGIPLSVRKDCVVAREEDAEPQEDPFCYTTFIHLRDVFDRQWGLFCKLLPKCLASDKPKFLSDLGKLNVIRNRIMHPVRGYRPTRDDFDLVTNFAARLFAEEPTQSPAPIS